MGYANRVALRVSLTSRNSSPGSEAGTIEQDFSSNKCVTYFRCWFNFILFPLGERLGVVILIHGILWGEIFLFETIYRRFWTTEFMDRIIKPLTSRRPPLVCHLIISEWANSRANYGLSFLIQY